MGRPFRLTPKMRQALRSLSQDRSSLMHPRTQRALRGEGLIEPTHFVPAFPVPVPDEWRLTRAGKRAIAKEKGQA